MAQRNWTFLSNEGRKYNIGVFHGPKAGHVLIYCNLKILIIDFHVLETKSYAFFLGEELCEIILQRQEKGFSYHFKLDRDIDTPYNRARKARERKHWYQSLAFFGMLGLCVIFFSAWVLNNKPNQHTHHGPLSLPETADQAVADVYLGSNSPEGLHISYAFIANGNRYQAEAIVSDTLLQNGMPIKNGDQFMTRYDRYDPSINQIVWESPSPNQIERYRKWAINKHLKAHPDLPKFMVDCQVEVAYQIKGIEGLADIYFQDYSPRENEWHNQNSYFKLVRDIPFKNLESKSCW